MSYLVGSASRTLEYHENEHGMEFKLHDGMLFVKTKMGCWRLVYIRTKEQIALYHRNKRQKPLDWEHPEQSKYHPQKDQLYYNSVKATLNYIYEHDKFRAAEQIDKKLGYAMWGESINTILNFFFFGMGIGKTELDIPLLVVFILNVVLVVVFQQKTVDLTKVMNPEKHGSVYDRKFLDKWMESCDEAEKMDIYHAAWSSYRVMSVAYVGAWLVTYLAHMFCGMDFFASIVVTVLWLIQSCVYCYKSIYR